MSNIIELAQVLSSLRIIGAIADDALNW